MTNENNDELLEQLEEENATENTGEETGETTENIGENVAEGDVSNDTSEPETENVDIVPDADYTGYLQQILEELQLNNEKIEELKTYQEERDMTIFEKELSKYTTTEGLLFTLLLFVIAFGIFKITGGIIRCEKE